MTEKQQHIISFNVGSGEEYREVADEIKQRIRVFCAELGIPQGTLLLAMSDFCLELFRDKFAVAVKASIVQPEPEQIMQIPQTGEPDSEPPEGNGMDELMRQWIENGDVVQCPSGVSPSCPGYVHKTAIVGGICPQCSQHDREN